MNRRLADVTDKPPFVGDIEIVDVDFSNNMPVVQPIKLLPPKAPYEIVSALNLRVPWADREHSERKLMSFTTAASS
jgi:hypothetical protein